MPEVPARINDPELAAMPEIGRRLADGEPLIVQFSCALYTGAQLEQIDELCATYGEKLTVRFFGHYTSTFDANVVRSIPHVVSLSLDCLINADNVHAVADLPRLQHLALDIFDLQNPGVLRFEGLRALRSLAVGDTRSTRIDLTPIAECTLLESLRISGQTHGLHAIAELPELQELTLRSISRRTSLGFVSHIAKLDSLSIVLGGRDNVNEIAHSTLRVLELIRIRGLSDVGDLVRFPALDTFHVEDQIRINALRFPEGSACTSLRILNCKTLSSLDGLERLPLRELRIAETSLDPDVLLSSLPNTLEICAIYTGKERENRRIRQILDQKGYREFDVAMPP
jgi:protein phosphatase 1 regulatory subunit 7